MPQNPKRVPGEPNPVVAPVESPDWESGGHGNDYGVARAIFALLDWRKRRKAMKTRRA